MGGIFVVLLFRDRFGYIFYGILGFLVGFLYLGEFVVIGFIVRNISVW